MARTGHGLCTQGCELRESLVLDRGDGEAVSVELAYGCAKRLDATLVGMLKRQPTRQGGP